MSILLQSQKGKKMNKVGLPSRFFNAVTDSLQLILEIRTVIAELEEEFREDGDNVSTKIFSNVSCLHQLSLNFNHQESGDELKRILESPNQVASLHENFSRKLPGICEKDTFLSRLKRRDFFVNFKSTDGTALSDDQVSNLVSFTRHWEFTEESVGILEVCSILWANEPILLWKPDRNIIHWSMIWKRMEKLTHRSGRFLC